MEWIAAKLLGAAVAADVHNYHISLIPFSDYVSVAADITVTILVFMFAF